MYTNIYDKFGLTNLLARDDNTQLELFIDTFYTDFNNDETVITDIMTDYADELIKYDKEFYDKPIDHDRRFTVDEIEFKPSNESFTKLTLYFDEFESIKGITDDERDKITDIINDTIDYTLKNNNWLDYMDYSNLYDRLQTVTDKFFSEEIVKELESCLDSIDILVYGVDMYSGSVFCIKNLMLEDIDNNYSDELECYEMNNTSVIAKDGVGVIYCI